MATTSASLIDEELERAARTFGAQMIQDSRVVVLDEESEEPELVAPSNTLTFNYDRRNQSIEDTINRVGSMWNIDRWRDVFADERYQIASFQPNIHSDLSYFIIQPKEREHWRLVIKALWDTGKTEFHTSSPSIFDSKDPYLQEITRGLLDRWNKPQKITLPDGRLVAVPKWQTDFTLARPVRGHDVNVAIKVGTETRYIAGFNSKQTAQWTIYSPVAFLYDIESCIPDGIRGRLLAGRLLDRWRMYHANARDRTMLNIANYSRGLNEAYRSLAFADKTINPQVVTDTFEQIKNLVDKEKKLQAVWFDNDGKCLFLARDIVITNTQHTSEATYKRDYPNTPRVQPYGWLTYNVDNHYLQGLSVTSGRHPNQMNSGSFCLGGAESTISRLIGNGNYPGAIRYLLTALERANGSFANNWRPINIDPKYSPNIPHLTRGALWSYIKPLEQPTPVKGKE